MRNLFYALLSFLGTFTLLNVGNNNSVLRLLYFLTEKDLNSPSFPQDSVYQKGPGPSAPEVQRFTPHGVTEMVDPFTGDFSYSIPLMDIEGYPLTITYNSGIKPEDEAGFTGLGWNLNIGQVNRNMRGLPDDFSGDPVKKSFNLKPQVTVGGSLKASLELFGVDPTNAINIG